MRNRYGITEQFWNSLPEDKKFLWKLVTWATAFVAALMITKTGVRVFDWAVVGFSTLTALLIMESQRNLRRYKSPILRKRLIRTTVRLGVSGATLLGVAFFTGIGYVIAKAFFVEYLGRLPAPMSRPEGLVTALSIAAGVSIGLFKSFRDLNLEDIFYKLPLSGLKNLLVVRPFVANSFPEFAFFEMVVVVVAYFYSSTVAQVVQTLIDATRL